MPTDRASAVAMADMWYAIGLQAPGSELQPSRRQNQNGVDFQPISNLSIGFPLFGN